jgi:tetratricopeptide (TPR) repeat protein
LFGRDDEAIAAGIKTVGLSPLSPFYTGWLAEQYRDAGDYEKAIEMFESVLRLYPEYPVAWLVNETKRRPFFLPLSMKLTMVCR